LDGKKGSKEEKTEIDFWGNQRPSKEVVQKFPAQKFPAQFYDIKV